MVTEIDRAQPGCLFIKRDKTVVLPHPEGADRISKNPFLFDVLDLLSDFFKFRFYQDDCLRDFRILSF